MVSGFKIPEDKDWGFVFKTSGRSEPFDFEIMLPRDGLALSHTPPFVPGCCNSGKYLGGAEVRLTHLRFGKFKKVQILLYS